MPTSGEGVSLAVTGRAEIPQVLDPVVKCVTADVVDLQYESFAQPSVSRAASDADVWHASVLERPMQAFPRFPTCPSGQPTQDLIGRLPSRRTSAPVVRLPEKMLRRQPMLLDGPFQLISRRTGIRQCQLLQDAGQADRAGHGFGEALKGNGREAVAPLAEVRGIDGEVSHAAFEVTVRAPAGRCTHVLDHLTKGAAVGCRLLEYLARVPHAPAHAGTPVLSARLRPR